MWTPQNTSDGRMKISGGAALPSLSWDWRDSGVVHPSLSSGLSLLDEVSQVSLLCMSSSIYKIQNYKIWVVLQSECSEKSEGDLHMSRIPGVAGPHFQTHYEQTPS